MKIVLFIHNMGKGGAERVMSIMANYWAKKQEVYLITIGKAEIEYALNGKVELIQLGLSGASKTPIQALKRNLNRITVLRKTIKRIHPDILISFCTNNNIIAAIAGYTSNIPVLISERANPKKENIPKFWLIQKKIWYEKTKMLVLQTEGVKEYYQNYKCKTKIIQNPLSIPFFNTETSPKNQIISIGRLSSEKNHESLIRAFSKIRNKDWSLKIVGDGPLRQKLENLVGELNLNDRVVFTGKVSDVFYHLKESKIFVLPSLNEGYPNALIEAMAAGLAVISTDIDFGPNEIIMDMENGTLVPTNDSHKLSAAIEFYIDNPKNRKKHGEKAKEIIEVLKEDIIMKKWDNLIYQVISNK